MCLGNWPFGVHLSPAEAENKQEVANTPRIPRVPGSPATKHRCSEAPLSGKGRKSFPFRSGSEGVNRAGGSQMLLQLPNSQSQPHDSGEVGLSAHRQAVCLGKMAARRHWARDAIVPRKGSTMCHETYKNLTCHPCLMI